MGVASLVLGIASIVVGLFINTWVGVIAGIVGIILAAVAKKKGQGGVATAGLVLSIIGVAIVLVAYIACIACAASVAAGLGAL